MALESKKSASAIASILLVATEPVHSTALSKLLGEDRGRIEQALDYLESTLANTGIRLERHNNQCQLVTAPENAEIVRAHLRVPEQPRVSRPALETLAILAYRQPATRGDLEEIRGVNCDRIVANLVARGLVEERGHRDSPGRPMQYGTTPAFLQFFGLQSIADLPPPAASGIERAELRLLGLRNRDEDEVSGSAGSSF